MAPTLVGSARPERAEPAGTGTPLWEPPASSELAVTRGISAGLGARS